MLPKSYVDTFGTLKLNKAGDAMTGSLSLGNNRITDVGNPTNAQNMVTRYYLEHLGILKFVVTSGTLPTSTSSDITPTANKTVAIGKITIVGFWVERASSEWLDSNSGQFNTEWSFFDTFTRGPTILVYFSSAPASGWTRNFRLHMIEYP